MDDIQICEVDALPVPFSLAQQWVGTVEFYWISMVTSHASFS
jgi:hypothetical protein